MRSERYRERLGYAFPIVRPGWSSSCVRQGEAGMGEVERCRRNELMLHSSLCTLQTHFIYNRFVKCYRSSYRGIVVALTVNLSVRRLPLCRDTVYSILLSKLGMNPTYRTSSAPSYCHMHFEGLASSLPACEHRFWRLTISLTECKRVLIS